MTITFEIPRDIEQQLCPSGSDLSGKAREAFLVELFREREISHRQLAQALGLERYETDGLLKKYGVGLDSNVEEIRAACDVLSDARPV